MKSHLKKAIPTFILWGIFHLLISFPAIAAPALVTTYEELLQAIRLTRQMSAERMQQAIERETLQRAWETGKLIEVHVLQHKERADYAKQVLLRLSHDLGISATELSYSRQFARAYPDKPPQKLIWRFYRELLSIDGEADRKQLEERAFQEKWSWERLRFEIKKYRRAKSDLEEKLVAFPGKLYVYQVLKSKSGPHQGQLVLDLGFSDYYKPEGLEIFQEGDLLECQAKKCVPALGLEKSDLYTYRAYEVRVIDGDTLQALVDLGFGITASRIFRLRGLDAPEIDTEEGMQAKAFLENKFQEKEKAVILIKAKDPDKYHRYLADVFIDGTYLNQELIENDLAVTLGR